MKKLLRVAALMAGASLFTVGLGGCEPYKQSDWETAPRTHVCTTDQMAKAQSEAAWCNENTMYFKTYCYGSAILRNCAAKTPNVK